MERTPLTLEKIPSDCLYIIFKFPSFTNLLHTISLVNKEFRDKVYKLFGDKTRNYKFIIKIMNKINHPKNLCLLSQFAQFLEKSITPPYLLTTPSFEKTAIESSVEHKTFLEEIQNRLRFNFGYITEYLTKKNPCYLYDIIERLRKLTPPQIFYLRKHSFNAQQSRTCICGKEHLPKYKLAATYEIDWDKFDHYCEYEAYIEIDSEKTKQKLIKSMYEEVVCNREISTIYKEISESGGQLVSRYKNTSQKEVCTYLILVAGVLCFVCAVTLL